MVGERAHGVNCAGTLGVEEFDLLRRYGFEVANVTLTMRQQESCETRGATRKLSGGSKRLAWGIMPLTTKASACCSGAWLLRSPFLVELQ